MAKALYKKTGKVFRVFHPTFSQKLLSVINEMYANKKTVIHNFLLLKELTIPVHLPA
jgi:hypothetical protein